MLQDVPIKKEVLQKLLAEMDKEGFTSTTLHEIRTFTASQNLTKRALDLAACTCQTPVLHPKGYCGYCGLQIPPSQ